MIIPGQNMVEDNLVDPFINETRPTLELLLVDTEQETARLQQEVGRLQQVAIQIKTSINRCSPISSLPPETLSRIFMLCCQPKYNTIGGVGSQGICPLRLSAVCKAWRDLAWTTSSLWSVIILIKPKPHALHLEGILASWIKRAGNQPLSIRYEAQSNDLLARLTQDTSKWMNVSMFLALESSFVIEKCKYFPLLQHLSIRVRAESPRPVIGEGYLFGFEHLDIFNAASLPKITHLHVPKFLRCLKPDLMWSQLRTFSVSTIGYEGLCKILDFARFLEVFNANSLEDHYSYNPPTVIHSNLRCLVLKGVYSTVLNELLSKPDIGTPNLEDLTIEIYRGNPDSTSLSNFVASLHQLWRFRVKYDDEYNEDPDWILKWLLNIPSLTELNVSISERASANLVSALGNPTSTEAKTEYLPLLANFTITVDRRLDRNPTMKDIAEMLAYRSSGLSPSISRLKSALIYDAYTYQFTPEDFNTFRTASLGDLALTMVDRESLSQSWYSLFFSLI
jgi:hypothetical protein